MTTKKYAGLEIVRAVAALIVVYNHIFTFELVPRNVLLSLPAQYATEAVMIFFVLSGVVITLSVERMRQRSAQNGQIVLDYLKARLLRIYPIFLVGLIAAVIAQKLIEKNWPAMFQIAGTALFLQSLPGYIVAVPSFNLPLWSLSNEVFYYVLFAISLLWVRFVAVWCVVALSVAVLFYPSPSTGGVAAHLVWTLALSLPWIMGHLIAKLRKRLPIVPVSFGVACFVIGLMFARCPITTNYYDIFRLTSFSLCCCPLMLALIQDAAPSLSARYFLLSRILLTVVGLLLLWTISPSLLVVKAALTIVAILAALAPLEFIAKGLLLLAWMRPALIYIGSISYAVYAIHAPIIALTVFLLPTTGSAPRIIAVSVLILITAHFMERIAQPMFSRVRPIPAVKV